ncbi:all-trans-8'-apo-beta-carotenal 15,15'-oxygenase [Nocardia amikacinitolerans]|uniref:carotenoid oxygenase family protein n=1 Tax=Nocardia amikacinitolerans TaxID=756689 RepID=UPI0020A2D9B7|nr:carotenoid oxygenase family protein [Nocardia amikacinitolerans]MCP2295134.1 all-trans-8'-apo-beta-carotenal 15,15'-oxygenase [Nocardia amikacinitolerans]
MTVDDAVLAREVYAPLLDELDYRVRQIDGSLPKELTGTLYRIGPGKHQVGRSLLHNIFDGDGMISQFVLDGSGVRFRNRYVRTRHFRHGERSDRIRYRGVGGQIPGGPLANFGRLPANVANTNIVNYAGGLLALWELGNPHRIDPDSLETLGPTDFGGKLGFLGAFSAHPKWDPVTGDMYNFGLDLLPTPRIRTYRVDRSGALRCLATVPMLDLGWNHDFALTERYMVFVLDPLLPNVAKMALATHSFIDSLDFKRAKGTRFLLVPKSGGAPRIVEHEALLHVHLTNAYDDGADVVVELVRLDTEWSEFRRMTGLVNLETPETPQFPASRLMQYRITEGGTVIERELADVSGEFPQYDWRRSTRRHRFSYLAGAGGPAGLFNSLIKVDHRTGVATECDLGPSSVGEPLFVARTPDAGEDDGWLLALNHQLIENRSQLVILDARDLERGPLATAWLEHHVPWGFHGTFTRRVAAPGSPVPEPETLPSR